MNVLNLFSGMEVGRLACERAGVPIDKYYSSEIDKYAIQVSKANWPDIIHLGDVTKVYGCTLPDIHLLLGGSPCQGFSFAGKQLNFNDPRSALLFEFVRILKELREYNPVVYFLLENVMMKKEYQDVISELLGVQPVMINSALVSAQNRKRLYWTNIPFLGQPEDKGIVLKGILQTDFSKGVIMSDKMMRGFDKRKANNIERGTGFGADLEDKTNTLISGYGKNGKGCLIRLGNTPPLGRGMNGEVYSIDGKSPTLTTNKGEGSKIGCYQVGLADGLKGFDANRRIYSQDGKAPTLISSTGGHKAPKVNIVQLNPSTESGGKQPYMQNRVFDSDFKSTALTLEAGRLNVSLDKFENGFTYRKLTVTECERLQTVPDGYTQKFTENLWGDLKDAPGIKQISNTQAYKMLGNGWTTDVIAHLLLPLGDYSCLF